MHIISVEMFFIVSGYDSVYYFVSPSWGTFVIFKVYVYSTVVKEFHTMQYGYMYMMQFGLNSALTIHWRVLFS